MSPLHQGSAGKSPALMSKSETRNKRKEVTTMYDYTYGNNAIGYAYSAGSIYTTFGRGQKEESFPTWERDDSGRPLGNR